MDYFNYEICPKYPELIKIPESMSTLPGTYQMACRLPYSQPGPFASEIIEYDRTNSHLLHQNGVFIPVHN